MDTGPGVELPVRHDGVRQSPRLPGGGRHHRPPPLRLPAGVELGLDAALLRPPQGEARQPGDLRPLAERRCLRPQVLLHQQDGRPAVPALPGLGQSGHRPHLQRLEEQRGQAGPVGAASHQGGVRRSLMSFTVIFIRQFHILLFKLK